MSGHAANKRTLTGAATVAFIAALVGLSVTLFRGGLTETVPVTVLSPRAGLVMNPEAKVQFHGVQVGQVASIDYQPDGQAAIHLAMAPARLSVIPANVVANIASSTVFGAKYVQLTMPPDPSPESMHPGQVLDAQHVMVEVNTVFEQLTSVLSTIDPEKLNETLGSIASALHGRGNQIGDTLSNLNAALIQLNAHSKALTHDLAVTPAVVAAYADAAPHLISILDSATRVGQTIVDEQHDLDALLIGATGLSDVGTQVLHDNGQPLADVLRLLVPTTSLTNQYRAALTCGLAGVLPLAQTPPLKSPGVEISAGLMWGSDRYRYPQEVPKVAAKGGPQCTDLPVVPFNTAPPFVVTDSGANPWKYGNLGIHRNTDLLKRMLFGTPIDGPPRNSAQIGQPG
jgi:phospholipid/cholesterol/gamma-HCH transport system substrate-binding protein